MKNKTAVHKNAIPFNNRLKMHFTGVMIIFLDKLTGREGMIQWKQKRHQNTY